MGLTLHCLVLIIFMEICWTDQIQSKGVQQDICDRNMTDDDELMRFVPQCAQCQGRCGTISDFVQGIGCSCDSTCQAYHDCCPDYTKSCPNQATRLPETQAECYKFLGYNISSFYLLIDSCNGNKCEHSMEAPSKFVPVYDPDTKLHFVNHDCARCNGVRRLLVWEAVWYCDNIRENMTEITSEKKINQIWKFMKDNPHQCRVDFSHTGMAAPRTCGPYFPRKCHNSCTNPVLREGCKSNDMVYLYANGENYGNIMCFLCNEANLSVELNCYSRFAIPVLNPPENPFSFHLLFDFDTRKGLEVGKDDHGCQPETKWMPRERFCRKMSLPLKIIEMTLSHDSSHGKNRIKMQDDLYKAALVRFPLLKNVTVAFDHVNLLLKLRFIFDSKFNETENDVNMFIVKYFNIGKKASYPTYKAIKNCKFLIYQRDEVQDGVNGTVRIIKTNKVLQERDYFIQNGTIRVCDDADGTKTASLGPKDYVSIVCMSLSILALIARLCFHLVVPALDIVASRIQCCLAGALLLGMASFLIHPLPTPSTPFCYTVAVVIHWSLLAAFSWMTIIGFDILRMLKITYHLQHVGSRRKSFIIYSIFACCLPTIIITISLGLEHAQTDIKWKTSYGKSLCWISNRFALIIYFAVPSGVLFLVNIIMFILSIIYSHKGKTGSLIQGSNIWKERLVVHIKLLVLMGITWVFGFLAAPLNFDALWYIFIILSASQGLFLLITYIASRNVRDYLNSDSCCCKCKQKTDSSGSGTASSSL